MNWHILALAYRLEQVRLGKIRRLIVNMPPRSLKSIVAAVSWPAFLLGHAPSTRIIVVSYASELSTKHSNDFRAVLSAKWYRTLFPTTRISRIKNTEAEVVTTRHGFRLSTSVDGTLTGRGGDIIVVDDPLKSLDAFSGSKRERVTDWYNNTLLSRLDDKQKGAIVVVAQRLHVDDLCGALMRGSDEWTLLNLPAIAEQDEAIQVGDNEYHARRVGDVLHPEREPLEILDRIRAQLGSDTFSAQYQQQPVPPGGALIKKAWIKRYNYLPPRTSSSYVLQSWDTASKPGESNDFSAATTWLIQDGKHYLVDALRDRFDYPTLKGRAKAYAKVHEADTILIEDTGVGTALIAEFQNAGLTAVGVKPINDKVTRVVIQSAKFEAGQVFFPSQAPWLADLESELFAFPLARHDDLVDSISQTLAYCSSSCDYDSTYSWV